MASCERLPFVFGIPNMHYVWVNQWQCLLLAVKALEAAKCVDIHKVWAIPSDRDVWQRKKEKESDDLANNAWLMVEELRGKDSDMTNENINKRAQCVKKELSNTYTPAIFGKLVTPLPSYSDLG